MPILTAEQSKALKSKKPTETEWIKIIEKWPRCFVCGEFAEGMNGAIWHCVKHRDETIDTAIAKKWKSHKADA